MVMGCPERDDEQITNAYSNVEATIDSGLRLIDRNYLFLCTPFWYMCKSVKSCSPRFAETGVMVVTIGRDTAEPEGVVSSWFSDLEPSTDPGADPGVVSAGPPPISVVPDTSVMLLNNNKMKMPIQALAQISHSTPASHFALSNRYPKIVTCGLLRLYTTSIADILCMQPWVWANLDPKPQALFHNPISTLWSLKTPRCNSRRFY